MLPPPFVIFSLPRCRTKWLSVFLTYGQWSTGHDELRHCRSLEDVTSWFAQPCTGTVETGAAPFWRLLPDGITAAIVRRPIDEVMASLWRSGQLHFDAVTMAKHLAMLDAKLRQFACRRPNVLQLTFSELCTEEGAARLFEHCLPYRHDSGWWQSIEATNIQVSIPHARNYYYTHAPQLEKLRRLARHEMLRQFRRPVELNGVTFQQEPLWPAFHDAGRLAADECVAFGAHPEAWQEMNLPLWERLDASGSLHFYTARSNGKMFGYLVSAIGEAFHARDELEAEQVCFYADPSWPGLGRKLQHASIDDLRTKGVARVMMFQPDQTRVGLVYRRLGAQLVGQRFVMELQP